MDTLDPELTGALLNAHGALLLALVASHPDREKLMLIFGRLISKEIEDEEDPRRGALLQLYEETVRQAPELDLDP